MNTPTHIVLGLVVLGRSDRARLLAPIALGGLLPDAPMFFFYAVERFWNAQPERWLWSYGYFQAHWQDFFDLFNSLPVIAVGLAVAWRVRNEWWTALLLAMALHSAGDLLVHHDDAHRHLFPFSEWRFASPVSYWDPAHHGLAFATVEVVGGLACCAWLWRSHRVPWVRVLVCMFAALYLLGTIVALAFGAFGAGV